MGVIYICNHEGNVASQLSPQKICGTSYNVVQLHIIAITNEEKFAQKTKN